MHGLPDDIAEALARAAPRMSFYAATISWYDELSSTNDAAARLADSGAQEGTVVCADAQTAGRGRHGRVWISPARAGLYTSVVLRPSTGVEPLLTVAAGVAIHEGIRAATGLATSLKWPNDVYVAERKLAGILAEAGGRPTRPHVVVGFGINLLPAVHPPEVAARATSIEGELGRAVTRGAVLAECLAALAQRYEDLNNGRRADVVDRWRAYAAPTMGRRVEWSDAAGTKRGIVEDIAYDGALLVRADRDLVRVISGEVRWLL